MEVGKQCWKILIDEGKQMSSEDLELPIRRCFEKKLEKQTKAKNWCQKPPQWTIKCRSIGNNGAYLDAKEQWNEAIRDMEHCLERNDLKGFIYLEKRLKKKKSKQNPPKDQ
ncbi:hypothetical protein OXYTRIMIC_482 [Oxytricha trifallax]|uniref:Uncharacterized protein n=1 Tax=Oxytricha trifallax TaxID=1172189 RepID=A0A073HXP1_9SPIT|nr:hypothetical protein OXYTRIMIC_482 [Oxytricha trifallax]